jgi:hypothetical protein
MNASVAMTLSIVAMSGWIMPAPLAMPVSGRGAVADAQRCGVASLGRVSVVMIACAAASQPSGASRLTTAGIAGQQFVHRQLRADHARAHHKDGMLVRAQVQRQPLRLRGVR